MVIYVIGFIGSDRMAAARAASEEYGIPLYALYDLNAEIKERDGRSIRRMVITMGEHELRNKEYETLTAILKELGEQADPDPAPICSRGKAPESQTATAENAAEDAAGGSTNCSYSAVICCSDDLILDPMSADLVRAGKVIIADDPAGVMFERAIEQAQGPDGDRMHYAFLLDPDKETARAKFMKLYEQRRPLYEEFRK